MNNLFKAVLTCQAVETITVLTLIYGAIVFSSEMFFTVLIWPLFYFFRMKNLFLWKREKISIIQLNLKFGEEVLYRINIIWNVFRGNVSSISRNMIPCFKLYFWIYLMFSSHWLFKCIYKKCLSIKFFMKVNNIIIRKKILNFDLQMYLFNID